MVVTEEIYDRQNENSFKLKYEEQGEGEKQNRQKLEQQEMISYRIERGIIFNQVL